MCDILIANISNDPFLNACTKELKDKFRGLKEVIEPLNMAKEIYDREPPKVAILDCDDNELKTICAFIMPHVGYIIGFTNNYEDKELLKQLYKEGFNDVRPKRDIKSLSIAIRPVIKRRQTMTTRKISLA